MTKISDIEAITSISNVIDTVSDPQTDQFARNHLVMLKMHMQDLLQQISKPDYEAVPT